MLDRLRGLLKWSRTHQGRKLIRFTSVSVISTIVSQIAIVVLYGFRIIDAQIGATVAGNLIASLPSYNLNRRWAWGKTGRSHWRKEVVPFWTMAFLGSAFSIIGAAIVKSYTHSHHVSHNIVTVLLAIANLASFAIFWVLKLVVFNKIFRVNEIQEFDEHLATEEAAQA
jgi:putative flippase GtrA